MASSSLAVGVVVAVKTRLLPIRFREGEGLHPSTVTGDADNFKTPQLYFPRPSLQRLVTNVCKQRQPHLVIPDLEID
jgi:hypothetical protein